ncbi:MAG: hypothetical protein HOV66_19735 [Streptomycetaceae bacterium]|nr:hypothetical protein [Streptomycetaceae bacterium]
MPDAPLVRIRAAEALIRERAAAASAWDGMPWLAAAGAVYGGTAAPHQVVTPVTTYDGDAEHIATWHPAVALAVANWLRTAAMDLWAHGPLCCADGCEACDDELWMPHVRCALALADLLIPPDEDVTG